MNTSTFNIVYRRERRTFFDTNSNFMDLEYYDEEMWLLHSKKYQNFTIRPKTINWIKDNNHYRLQIETPWHNIYYSNIFNNNNLEKYKKIEESKKHSLEIYKILMQNFIKRIGIDYNSKK